MERVRPEGGVNMNEMWANIKEDLVDWFEGCGEFLEALVPVLIKAFIIIGSYALLGLILLLIGSLLGNVGITIAIIIFLIIIIVSIIVVIDM
jgi:hypothetical protein